MDFGGIVKRAWQLGWRHKALWVLGLFAGTSGGGFGGWGGSGYRFDAGSLSGRTSWPGVDQRLSEASAYLQEWAPLIIAALVLLFLVGVLWMVLSVAAQAGLAYEVDEVERGRPASARVGWSVGFHYWGRVFVVGLMLLLPILVLTLVVVSIAVVGVLAAVEGWGSVVVGLLLGLAALGVLLVPVLIVVGFAFSNMYVLAVRYIALENRSPSDALGASWRALRHRFKDVFLMWLVMLALSIGFGFFVAIPAGVVGVGAVLAVGFGLWPAAVALGLALLVVVMVLGAFWSTFTSAAWTLFFRSLTGRDAVVAQPVYADVPVGVETPANPAP